jgi:hypothetical protein
VLVHGQLLLLLCVEGILVVLKVVRAVLVQALDAGLKGFQ